MSKEEEATALAGTLSCLKYLFTIKVRREAFLEHLQAYFISFKQFSEFVQLVIGDFCS